MDLILLIPNYFKWHYGRALKDMLGISKNFIWFFYNYFSIDILTETLFLQWRRIIDNEYRGSLDIEGFFGALVVNVLMRLVGFFIRISVIIVGWATIFIAFAVILLASLIWLVLPAIIISCFVLSFTPFFL